MGVIVGLCPNTCFMSFVLFIYIPSINRLLILLLSDYHFCINAIKLTLYGVALI